MERKKYYCNHCGKDLGKDPNAKGIIAVYVNGELNIQRYAGRDFIGTPILIDGKKFINENLHFCSTDCFIEHISVKELPQCLTLEDTVPHSNKKNSKKNKPIGFKK